MLDVTALLDAYHIGRHRHIEKLRPCDYCQDLILPRRNESACDYVLRKFCDRGCWKKWIKANPPICPQCRKFSRKSEVCEPCQARGRWLQKHREWVDYVALEYGEDAPTVTFAIHLVAAYKQGRLPPEVARSMRLPEPQHQCQICGMWAMDKGVAEVCCDPLASRGAR